MNIEIPTGCEVLDARTSRRSRLWIVASFATIPVYAMLVPSAVSISNEQYGESMTTKTKKYPEQDDSPGGRNQTRKVSDQLVNRWKTVVNKKGQVTPEKPGQTIVQRPPIETFERQTTIGALPRIDADREVNEFEIQKTLGEGGMGLVRLARQTSLWRDVAIKTVLPEQLDEKSTHDLLRESWITGMLEHPNIVPIHALGVDENNAPMLVMKRVEGVSWREAMGNEELMPDSFRGGGGVLEDHLNILLQVCNALQFAHSKGIIHCDLKPENVMLGDYGEVYLLDWGIAVSVDGDGSGRLPKARDIDEVSGTPAFIAPELAEGAGAKVGERTDVYLLGAVLHRIITGEARHVAPTVMATLIKAYKSDPVDYGDGVPDELGHICNRATHVDPDGRYDDVETFRRAILEYQQHRESRRLSDEATNRLETLESKAETVIDIDTQRRLEESVDEESVVTEAYRLFSECRFGFEQAMTIWEGNEEARQGLRRAREVMIDIELRHRDAKSASVLLDELDESSEQFESFQQRLEQLRRELAEEAREIERNKQISRDVDISMGSRYRSVMCVFLGFLFGGVPFVNHWLIEQGIATLTFQDYFIQFGVITVGSAVVVGVMRERLFQNAINTRIVISIFIILGGCLTMRILGYILGLDPGGCIALEQGLLAFGLAMMAASIDWRLWPAAVAFFLGGVGGAAFPEHILHFDGASNAAALWLIAFAWRKPPENRR